MNWLVVLAIVPGLLVSCLVAAVLRRVAPRLGLVDHPGERKIHRAPMPIGGGLAIWAGMVLPLAAGQVLLESWGRQQATKSDGAAIDLAWLGAWGESLATFIDPHLGGLLEQSSSVWFLLAAGTVLLVLGLVDDLRGLDWRFRLSVEVLVAAAVVFGRGWSLTIFLDWPTVTGVLSVLWIVALVNSFNMLDNMDGLSAGVATIACGMLGTVMLLTPEAGASYPQLFVAGFLFLLLGALAGFLVHNWPPARLFMGDAGSYFIGFCLAVMTILATFSSTGAPRHAVLAPLCVLAVPLYDMVTVMWIRIAAGKSPFEGDNNHFSHRLVELGLTKKQAVLTIYLITAASGLGALVLRQVDVLGALVVVLMVVCLLGVIAILETTARRKMRL